MANPGLIKTFSANGSISPFRIVSWGTQDHEVKQANGPSIPLVGTADDVGHTSDNQVDVVLGDLPEIEYGGDVLRGDPLTSDADGRAVKATVSGSRIVGFAHISAAVGVIGPYNHAPGILP